MWNILVREMGYDPEDLQNVVIRVNNTSPSQALAYYRKKSDPYMAEAVQLLYGN